MNISVHFFSYTCVHPSLNQTHRDRVNGSQVKPIFKKMFFIVKYIYRNVYRTDIQSLMIFHYVSLESVHNQHCRISLFSKIITILTFMIITSIKKKITSHRVGEEVDNIELIARVYQEQQNNKKKQTTQQSEALSEQTCNKRRYPNGYETPEMVPNLSHQGNAKFKLQCNTTTLPPEWLQLRRLTMTSGSENEEPNQQLIGSYQHIQLLKYQLLSAAHMLLMGI